MWRPVGRKAEDPKARVGCRSHRVSETSGLGALRARSDQAMRIGGQGQRQRPRGRTRVRRQAPVCARRPKGPVRPQAAALGQGSPDPGPISWHPPAQPRPTSRGQGQTGLRHTSPLEPWPTPMGYTRKAGSGTPERDRYAFAHRCAWERVGVDGRSDGTGLHNSGRRRCRSRSSRHSISKPLCACSVPCTHRAKPRRRRSSHAAQGIQ